MNQKKRYGTHGNSGGRFRVTEYHQSKDNLSEFPQTVNEKIPVTNTRGESAGPLVSRLVLQGVQVNITAVLTLDQVRRMSECLSPAVAGCRRCHRRLPHTAKTETVAVVGAGRCRTLVRPPEPVRRPGFRSATDRRHGPLARGGNRCRSRSRRPRSC